MPDAQRARVLVVEDDSRTRDVFCEVLRRAGFDVEGAGTIAAAIDTLRHAPIRAIVTNLRLPDGSPVDVLAALRHMAPDRPIVVCSGSVTDEVRAYAADFGAVAILEKPVELQRLVEIVRAAA
jgi:two-component system, NtrC family, response regulator PilR